MEFALTLGIIILCFAGIGFAYIFARKPLKSSCCQGPETSEDDCSCRK